MFVRFYSKTKQNEAKSIEAGRPIFDEVEMVEVTLPGDRFYQPHFPAHEVAVTWDAEKKTDDTRTWAERFPNEYAAFKTSHIPSESGLPLEEWGFITRAQASELKALKIHTVEQLAAVNERNRAILGPGARALIAQAQAFIEQSREQAPVAKLAAQNEALQAELEALKARMAGFEDVSDEAPKRRGRPRKEEVEAE